MQCLKEKVTSTVMFREYTEGGNILAFNVEKNLR
jgi:hypothetical protein